MRCLLLSLLLLGLLRNARYTFRYMFKQLALLRERAARMRTSSPPCHIRTVPPALPCGGVPGAEECPVWTSDLL